MSVISEQPAANVVNEFVGFRLVLVLENFHSGKATANQEKSAKWNSFECGAREIFPTVCPEGWQNEKGSNVFLLS